MRSIGYKGGIEWVELEVPFGTIPSPPQAGEDEIACDLRHVALRAGVAYARHGRVEGRDFYWVHGPKLQGVE